MRPTRPKQKHVAEQNDAKDQDTKEAYTNIPNIVQR